MRKLLSYLKPYRGKIALATLLMAVSAACDLLLPTLMADVLDKGVYGAAEADTFGYILQTAGWMLGLSLLSLASVAGGYWVVYHVVCGYTWNLRSALFRKVHTMTLSELGRIGTSNPMLCGGILIIPLMFIGGVVLCMRKDFTLSLVILCAVPLLIAACLLLSGWIEHLWEVADEQCDKQNDLVRERLRGIRVIRAFDRERYAHERITDATRIIAYAKTALCNSDGIVRVCQNADGDFQGFKGILMRYAGIYAMQFDDAEYQSWIISNAFHLL